MTDDMPVQVTYSLEEIAKLFGIDLDELRGEGAEE